MSISKIKSNRDRVYDYVSTFEKKLSSETTVYIDMEKINNFHIFKQKYAVFHRCVEYKSHTGKILFNMYVSPIGDSRGVSILSVLVKVDETTVDDILTSLSTTDPRVKKKDV